MPLPRHQPVKKRAKVVGRSLEELDNACLSKIIAFALDQAKARDEEPYVGDNRRTERNLSLVSRRWYFLTQTQISNHGVHRIDLEGVLKQIVALKAPITTNRFASGMQMSTSKTPRRIGLHASVALTSSRTPGGAPSVRKRLHYGVLSQRNLTVATGTSGQKQVDGDHASNGMKTVASYDIKLFRAIQPKLLKYKHVQLSESLAVDNFDKLLVALDAARIERLDLLKLKVENSRLCVATIGAGPNLNHLQTLTYTWTNNPKEDTSNALLWMIYERAVNLRELEVYLTDDFHSNSNGTSNKDDSQHSSDSTHSAPALTQSAICDINGKLAAPSMSRPHRHLTKVVFEHLLPANVEASQYIPVMNCDYSILIKRVLAQESSVLSLNTNDCSLIDYLIQASSRVCTKHELRLLRLTHPIKSIEMLQRLVRLPNLGTNFLSILIDGSEQIGEVRAALENFSLIRKQRARCQLNLHLRDQKFADSEEKVKQLIGLCRLVDVSVHISALQRISIDCCHLMWSTGRALQAITMDGKAGKCIFRISLQTYPIKANTVNPCEITVPFGKCAQYKISSSREDIVRHREIMKALKRDCYHQFVKSVRDNNAP